MPMSVEQMCPHTNTNTNTNGKRNTNGLQQGDSVDGQEGGFVVRHDSFHNILGPSPTLRQLLTAPGGLPLFHEAGIHLRNSNQVYVSSNRIPSKLARQRIAISVIPLADIPPPPQGTGLLPSLRQTDPEAFQKLSRAVKTFHELPQGIVMPNGATPWTSQDGQEAVLWCDQGRHDLDGQGSTSVPSSLVVMVPGPSDMKIGPPLVDNYNGKPFSSLNDVVVHQQSGLVFFTDPDYGVGQSFKRKDEEYAPNALYAWNPQDGKVTMIDDRYDQPNGVTFIPDPLDPSSGRGLLVTTDTGRFYMTPNDSMGEFHVDEQRPACIYTYPIQPKGSHQQEQQQQENHTGSPLELPISIGERSLLAHSESPIPDGIHPDEQGNLWAGSGDGVHVYNPTTRVLIGKILLPRGKGVANFCWAGKVTVYEDDDDDPPHQDGQERLRQRRCREMYRLLLFCEDELWEACIAVDGRD